MPCVLPALQLFAAVKPQTPAAFPAPWLHNPAHLFDHMQNSCSSSCCFALGCCIANATATATATRRRRLCLTLSATCQKTGDKRQETREKREARKEMQKNVATWRSGRDNALLWHKYECHQINMRRIWLTILWYNMLSACNGSCCCCYCCWGTLLLHNAASEALELPQVCHGTFSTCQLAGNSLP